MKNVVIIGLILLLVSAIIGSVMASSVSQRYSWNYLVDDVPGVPQYTQIGVGDDGNIWVVYMDGSDYKFVNVSWYDGSSWYHHSIEYSHFNLVGSGIAKPVDIVMVGSTPHIFYYDWSDDQTKGWLNHTYYDGSWEVESIWSGGILSNKGLPSNAISAGYYNGTFYVVFSIYGEDYITSPRNSLCMAMGSTGNWNVMNITDDNSYHIFYGDVYSYNSTKVGISIYEQYNSPNSGKVYYIKYVEFNGAGFSAIENITSETTDYVTKLLFDSQGNPRIFYTKIISGGSTVLQQLWKSGNTWQSNTVDSTYDTGKKIDGCLSSNGSILLTYEKSGQAGMQFAENSSTWHFEELNDPLSGNGRDGGITTDNQNNIYISYINWNTERADNYYIVVATTKTSINEFSSLAVIVGIGAIMIAVVYFRRISY